MFTMRRRAILRRVAVEHFKRKILRGQTSPEDFKHIECGIANIIVKEMYDGNIKKWLCIIHSMAISNPGIFDYMIHNKSQFVIDYENTI